MTFNGKKPAAPNSLKGTVKVFNNDFKKEEKQPDLTGNMLIPYDLVNQVADDPDSQMEYNGVQYIKLRLALWKAEDEEAAIENKEPLLSGSITQFVKQQSVPAKKPGMKKRLT